MKSLRLQPLVQLSLVRTRELLREPEALFWIFVFPLLLAIALGIAFRARPADVLDVAVETSPGAEWIEEALDAAPDVDVRRLGEEEARQALRTGKVALVVLPGPPWTYWLDPTRPESRLARLAVDDVLQRAAGRADSRPTAIREMTEKGSRYIDFLIPGLLGMNLMSTGIWGIGFYVVNMRQKRLMKRLTASPMRRSDFLLAQIAGRLVFLVPEILVLVAFGHYVLDVPVRGSLFLLIGIGLLGAIAFSGMGLLVGSRARTIEGVSGLMNLVMMPMWIASGIFFSTARFPDWMQPAIQALPLTAANDSLRAVMLEGAGLTAVAGEIGILVAWGAACFAGALALFRWQ